MKERNYNTGKKNDVASYSQFGESFLTSPHVSKPVCFLYFFQFSS